MTQVVASPHATGADDAHLRVELKEGVRAVGLWLLLAVVGAGLVDVGLDVGAADIGGVARGLQLAAIVLGAGHAAVGDLVVAQADFAGAAVLDAVTGEAAVGVVGQNDGQDFLAHLGDLRCVGADDHAVHHVGRAGERQSAHPLDLDRASAAARIWRQSIQVTKIGYREAGILDDLNQRSANLGLNRTSINGDRRHKASPVAGTQNREAIVPAGSLGNRAVQR